MAPHGFVQGVEKRIRKRSRGRFFQSLGAPRRGLQRIPYEMFSVVMLAILAPHVRMRARPVRVSAGAAGGDHRGLAFLILMLASIALAFIAQ